ncbi:MAG: bifunctional DNA-formamidopyrimidine glycosylase/DNA-(apurinic or apyrimidinic site) lyase [Patescibacteria group bacterium]|nr:bifunctional DNA-formamidopyrimidine glycosylase/DNA-(apurinic or apyrimidinic site) lyase [Patescibacteria group bacterium]
MPELPEVETIKRGLEKKIIGQKISRIDILDAKPVGSSNKNFKNKLKGRKIKSVKRRAKILIIGFDSDLFMIVHLKITGQLVYHKKNDQHNKYTRVIFYFTDQTKLYFNDMRKFGYLKLFNKTELEKELKRLDFGPEPLSSDFRLKNFREILKKRKNKPIKPLLMDPRLIAGIGNIYASEACFLAGIRPSRRAGTLTKKESEKIFKAVKKVLKKSLKYGGTSADAYINAEGKEGDFEKMLYVYGRRGEKCKKCQAEIKSIKQAGRGTYFCSNCQK